MTRAFAMALGPDANSRDLPVRRTMRTVFATV